MCKTPIARERIELAHTNCWKILLFCLSRKQNQKAPHGVYWILLRNKATEHFNYLDAFLGNVYIKICLAWNFLAFSRRSGHYPAKIKTSILNIPNCDPMTLCPICNFNHIIKALMQSASFS